MTDRHLNPWHPMTDETDLAHLGKLAEELAECGAVVARCIIQGIGGSEPSTGKPNKVWLEDEIADVYATIEKVVQRFELDDARIFGRKIAKEDRLTAWHDLIARGAAHLDAAKLRQAAIAAREELINLRDKHLSHTAAIVRALVQKRIEQIDGALVEDDGSNAAASTAREVTIPKAQAAGKSENILKMLREHLPEILEAIETDCGTPDETDGDDDTVGSYIQDSKSLIAEVKPLALTFGHIRRLREIVRRIAA